MSGFTNRKNWLSGLLTVSLAVIPTCTITAEENSKIVDQYIIVELEPVSVSESDTAESVSETELSTEETVEVESDPDVVLFSLQEGLDKEEYSITGISANEPIIAQLLAQTADYQDYDTIALYDLVSHQQTADEPYDFSLQIPENADITLYQGVDGQLQKSTLDAMYTEDEYNRLPLVSYQSETNHWLVFYLGAKQTDEETSDSDTEIAAQETESVAESLEGKTESEMEEKENTKAPETKPAIPTTVAPTTTPSTAAPSTKASETKAPETAAPTTTAHTHNWVAVTTTVHHDAVTSQVWKEDSAAWDETVVTKAAWDEQVLVQDAYDENVMISDAYDEPVYAWVAVCNECGHKFLDPNEDIDVHMGAGCWSSWHGEWMQVGTTHHDAVYQTVHHEATYQTIHHEAETTIVHHDATGHNEQAVDQAAWDETVITGYTCSGCGAVKGK